MSKNSTARRLRHEAQILQATTRLRAVAHHAVLGVELLALLQFRVGGRHLAEAG